MRPIEAFNSSIERARSLLELHKSSFPRGRPPTGGEPDDILRAIIVFGVAALDSYIHDKIMENSVTIIMRCARKNQNFPGPLIDILKPSLSTEKALCLLYRRRPDEEIRKIVGKSLSEKTYQDPGQIERGLKVIGIDDIWHRLRIKLDLGSHEKAKRFILPYVKRRHQIVHEGDLYKSRKYRHKPRQISRTYARNCLDHIRRFVDALEREIDQQISRKFSS